ncbi:hypothetical protein B7P43_G15380, partial [Cryptotermes secundus]
EIAGVGSFQNRCRLCISEARLSLKLFETEAKRLNIINKIRIYLTIQVSQHDGLPQQICYECLSRIELFHSYKQSCLESQHTLKHWNLFCEGGELQEDVLNINITSESVKDKSDGQSEVAEAQPTQSYDQLPKKRSIIVSPKSRNSQSCRASHRISDHFESEGNSVGDCEVECSATDKRARRLRDSAFSTAAEHELAQVRERTTRSSAICMCSVLHSKKETSVQNFSPPSEQNSKTFVQNCKTHNMDVPEHCSQVSIEMQTAPSMSSSIQSPSESTSGSVMRFLDSTLEQYENEGSSVSDNKAECEVTDISARELRDGAPSSMAKQKSVKTVAKTRNSSPVSVDCTRILSGSKEALRQNLGPLSQYNSKASVRNQRLQTYSAGSQSGVNVPIKRSLSMSLLIQNPLKVYTSPVLTSDMTLNQTEGVNNSIVDGEDECEVCQTAGRESSGSTSCTVAKCESLKNGLKRKNKGPLFVRSVPFINREASRQKCTSLHKSRISEQDQRIQIATSGNHSVVDMAMRGGGSVSSRIYDAHPLVTFPDSVVKELNTDRYCHITNDAKDLEMTKGLEEQEKNVTQSENEVVSSAGQNESVQMDVRANGEHVNYPSVQALLKILESDDDSISIESDIENSQVGKMLAYSMCRPATPGPSCRRKSSSTECDRDLTTAYVKVEKLSEKKKGTVLKVCGMVKLKPAAKQTQKLQRGSSKKQKIQSNQYRLVKPVEDETTGKVRYKCLKCGSLLSHKHYIKEHMKIHTGDKSFACSTCDRAFRNKYMLKSHMVVHLAEKNFECDVCNHRFVGTERLKRHMRLHRNKSFVCPMCGRSCTQKQSLQRHMRVHTGERPFKCEFCDGAFADRTTWINHKRIHTGERPFKCEECNKTFSRSVNLLAHKRAAHSDARPFGCQLCMNRFKTKAHLVKHLSCIHKDLMKSVVNFMKEEQPSKNEYRRIQ